jgi:hypothetical protein
MGRDTLRLVGIVVCLAAIVTGAILAVDGYNTYTNQGTGLPLLFIGAIVVLLGIWFMWATIASMNLDRAGGGKAPKTYTSNTPKKSDGPKRLDL